jgi:hypothetical protein
MPWSAWNLYRFLGLWLSIPLVGPPRNIYLIISMYRIITLMRTTNTSKMIDSFNTRVSHTKDQKSSSQGDPKYKLCAPPAGQGDPGRNLGPSIQGQLSLEGSLSTSSSLLSDGSSHSRTGWPGNSTGNSNEA